MKPAPRIVVFDSGVGGLTVLQEIRALLPHCSYVYVSDNFAVPYGTKPDAEVSRRVESVIRAVVHEHLPDVLVIACNTVSTLTLDVLRSLYPFPIVGVVPAIKPAAAMSKSKVIGLLATPPTIIRPYTGKLISEFAADCRVIRVGSTILVEIAEALLRGQDVDLAQLHREIEPIFNDPTLDVVVLGCTHFPLLRRSFVEAQPRPIAWIDSGAAIAQRVRTVMQGDHLASVGETPKSAVALFTKDDSGMKTLQHNLSLQFNINEVRILKV